MAGVLSSAAVAMLLAGICGAQTSIPGATNDAQAQGYPRWLYVHDPSTIVKCGKEYWIFSTGPGISSRHSTNLKTWDAGPRVFLTPPSWTTNTIQGFRGYFWAPDIIYANNRYLLYYSVSRWGVNTSAIGLATNVTLDLADPSFAWQDQGVVCESTRDDSYNTIDPSVMRSADGSTWLAFGSFWTGIKLIELDPGTGKRIATNSPIYSLAFHDSIEAPCLWQRGKYYYLFVNWGLCCRGTNSTYNIRVGRSLGVTGPYLDKEGKDMFQSGGTLFLTTEGSLIGPGHAAIYQDGPTDWFSFHFYDGTRGGSATLAVRQLNWSEDGWPIIGRAPR